MNWKRWHWILKFVSTADLDLSRQWYPFELNCNVNPVKSNKKIDGTNLNIKANKFSPKRNAATITKLKIQEDIINEKNSEYFNIWPSRCQIGWENAVYRNSDFNINLNWTCVWYIKIINDIFLSSKCEVKWRLW